MLGDLIDNILDSIIVLYLSSPTIFTDLFMFKEYSPASLLYTLQQAIEVFTDKTVWKKLIDRAMKLNFSWQTAAESYDQLYNKLIN